MKKCVANLQNGYSCITADRLVREDSIIFVYNGNDLVAMFDIGELRYIYVSEVKD